MSYHRRALQGDTAVGYCYAIGLATPRSWSCRLVGGPTSTTPNERDPACFTVGIDVKKVPLVGMVGPLLEPSFRYAIQEFTPT
jgi:hypothetical protein